MFHCILYLDTRQHMPHSSWQTIYLFDELQAKNPSPLLIQFFKNHAHGAPVQENST